VERAFSYVAQRPESGYAPYGMEAAMTSYFTAKYTPIPSGFMGQIVEWPEVVTEGASLDACRASLIDAVHEMSAAYGAIGKDIPLVRSLFEQIPVEV